MRYACLEKACAIAAGRLSVEKSIANLRRELEEIENIPLKDRIAAAIAWLEEPP